jgi:hypothetical protein
LGQAQRMDYGDGCHSGGLSLNLRTSPFLAPFNGSLSDLSICPGGHPDTTSGSRFAEDSQYCLITSTLCFLRRRRHLDIDPRAYLPTSHPTSRPLGILLMAYLRYHSRVFGWKESLIHLVAGIPLNATAFPLTTGRRSVLSGA